DRMCLGGCRSSRALRVAALALAPVSTLRAIVAAPVVAARRAETSLRLRRQLSRCGHSGRSPASRRDRCRLVLRGGARVVMPTLSPRPLAGRGRGWGYGRRSFRRSCRRYPPPCPPPHGGRVSVQLSTSLPSPPALPLRLHPRASRSAC